MIRRLLLLAPLGLALSGCQPAFTTSGAWTEHASPPTSTATSIVVATADGRVVVLGGFQMQTGEPLGDTVVLDPSTGRWGQAAPIPEPRTLEVAVPLADGTLLVAAGQGGSEVQHRLYRSTWIFDPSADRWNRAGDLHTARTSPSGVRLTDGRVLLVGGSDENSLLASAEVYDSSTKTWSTAGSLSLARTDPALVALPHGGALAVGGCLFPGNQRGVTSQATAEIFNPGTAGWVSTQPLPEARCGPSAVGLADGRVLVVGGIVDQPNGFATLPSALLFDPRTASWVSAGSPIASGGVPFPPGGIGPPPAPAGVLLRDGRVFLPVVQSGPIRGHVTTTIVGGQLFNPSTGEAVFATSTAVDVASLFGEPTPVPAALPSGRVVVLLDTIALGFDPQGRPPAGQALDNLSLTWLLLGLNGVLLLLLAIGLLLGRSRESRAMARL